jgi:host factor-I protein
LADLSAEVLGESLDLLQFFDHIFGQHAFVYNACMPFRTPPGNPNAAKRGRTPPPEDTFEEAAFLKALGEKQKPVSVKLLDGQTFRGWIEYYDKHMVRLTREGAPNLFIFKHEIMYIAEDGGKRK